MKITIYDYNDSAVKIKIPNKPIRSIFVVILTGDETGLIEFEDGTSISFDASDSRTYDFIDGSYLVTGKDIDSWLNFKPSRKGTAIAYERQNKYRG